jgi:gamma-glutamylcyclotransferase (GGCT)/AIG2-like uncharacterized protein YtfP
MANTVTPGVCHELEACPPPPPPLPPLPLKDSNTHAQVKLKTVPIGHFEAFDSTDPKLPEGWVPPTGLYFFYGTLMDPGMLMDILSLDEEPVLRPASITGYALKLWGQYPALVEPEEATDQSVSGAVYHVRTEEDARKLADYETSNYRPQLCSIRYTDGKEPTTAEVYAYIFVGGLKKLSDGEFDLSEWLKRVGRAKSRVAYSPVWWF